MCPSKTLHLEKSMLTARAPEPLVCFWRRTQGLASMNAKAVVGKPQGQDLQGYPVAVLVVSFFGGKNSGSSVEHSTGNYGWFHCMANTHGACSSSLFLVVSIHLSFLPLDEVRLNWVPTQVPGRLGSWSFTLPSLAQHQELFLAGQLIPDVEWGRPRDGVMQMG